MGNTANTERSIRDGHKQIANSGRREKKIIYRNTYTLYTCTWIWSNNITFMWIYLHFFFSPSYVIIHNHIWWKLLFINGIWTNESDQTTFFLLRQRKHIYVPPTTPTQPSSPSPPTPPSSSSPQSQSSQMAVNQSRRRTQAFALVYSRMRVQHNNISFYTEKKNRLNMHCILKYTCMCVCHHIIRDVGSDRRFSIFRYDFIYIYVQLHIM